MKLFSLLGGVHPEGRKELSAERSIRCLPLPKKLFVPFQQYIGAPATPMVNMGDKVLKGQLIAVAQGMVSSAIHAPTSGLVVAMGDYVAPHPSGLPVPTITLESDGEDKWIETQCQRQIEISAFLQSRNVRFPRFLSLQSSTLPVDGGLPDRHVSPWMVLCWFVSSTAPSHRFIYSFIERFTIGHRSLPLLF